MQKERENISMPWFMMHIMMMMSLLNKSSVLPAFDCENPQLEKIYLLLYIEECSEATPTQLNTTQ